MPRSMWLVSAIAVTAVLSACGSDAKTITKTVERTTTIGASGGLVPSLAAQPSPPDGTGSAVEPSGAIPSVSGIVQPSRVGSPLTLTDFFDPDGTWSQAVVNVADRSNIQGIVGEVDGCGSTNFLELRLQDRFHTLKFEVAEDNASSSSDQTLVVTVTANGKQVTAKRVQFNQVQPFSIPVGSVNSIKMMTEVDPQVTGCGSAEVNPVFFNVLVS